MKEGRKLFKSHFATRVSDDKMPAIKALAEFERTGQAGVGRVFVSPIKGLCRIPKGEANNEAI